jgi:ADP-ribose pyrophosphatase YjhB (NUDIX family)
MSNIAIILLRNNDEPEMFMVAQKHYSYDCDDCKKNSCNEHIEYTNPAGKIQKDESNKDAAMREFLEETGQSLPDININDMKVYEECDTVIIISVLKDTNLISKNIDSEEIKSVRWVKLRDIPNLKLREIFRKLYGNYIHIWKSMLV